MIIKQKITWSMGHAMPQIHGHNWTAIFEYEGSHDQNLFEAMFEWIYLEWEGRTLIHVNNLALLPYHHAENQFDIEATEVGFIPVGFEPDLINIATKLHIQACQMIDLDPYRLVVELSDLDGNSVRYYLEETYDIS